MDALNAWDAGHEVKCLYRQKMVEFSDGEWRSEFQVHGGMILEGEWFVKI